ncbi:rhodanese-related sulfurtransferase [Arsenicitalea aurantiaca]|uniref:tRNA uridine(34) hydroxylase n=2 Tax=Arsenicitalea aurantiaca TaxID=1783274 RepID=A0A433X8W2_9HYPH|nr:rhodanese-related sulfurtransferase [Arsenicitalea aurantiaca]RUT30438.1 rhodanese-related sulfurtransferase [Arsenicitalea aurantiaca]
MPPQTNAPFTVLAIYKFAELPDHEALKAPLAAFCCAREIRGTLILAPEGLNGTVAGTREAIAELVSHLLTDGAYAGRFVGAEIKYASAETMPFLRMKVRTKPEIVTLRAPEANPARRVGTYVAPQAWNGLIAEPDVRVIDTRNDYEVRLGRFAGAEDPATTSFTDFKAYVETHLDPERDRKIAMYCTGGIRCEKASAYLLEKGFEAVYHLKGGILAYLETVPEAESLWQGECFVFDERVAVGHGLLVGEASLCRACRMPLTAADRAHPDYVENLSCPHCAGDARKAASAAERQRQVELARHAGIAHLGEDAAADAQRRKAEKAELRARSAAQSTGTRQRS